MTHRFILLDMVMILSRGLVLILLWCMLAPCERMVQKWLLKLWISGSRGPIRQRLNMLSVPVGRLHPRTLQRRQSFVRVF